jgi:hypothetical protein
VREAVQKEETRGEEEEGREEGRGKNKERQTKKEYMLAMCE